MTTHRTTLIRCLIGGSILCLASPTLAQDDPMAGPEVRDRDVPGVSSTFGGEVPRHMRERPVPHRKFFSAVMSLNGADAPEGLALSESQAEQVREIARAFREEMRDFMREHGEDIRRARGPRGEDGDRGIRGDRGGRGEGRPRSEDVTPEQRERFEKLRAEMPGEEQRARIWAILSPEQQAHVERELERPADDPMGAGAERPRRNNPDLRFRAEGRPSDRPGEAPPGRPGPEREVTIGDLERALAKLTPEQRRRVLQRTLRLIEMEASGIEPNRRRGSQRGRDRGA